jgi:23S rRNA (guanosine2251-2'-O)-methyltransferase
VKPLRGTALKRFLKSGPRSEVDLAILLQDVEDPVNVGSAFRIADAAGAKEMVLSGITATPPHRLIDKVGRGKDRRVKWRKIDDVVEAIDTLKAQGWGIVAVEIVESAVPYYELSYPAKTCLLVGHEDHGVTKRALERTDSAVYIPMHGKGASLNVHVALAVVAFHVIHGGVSDVEEGGSDAAR